MGTNQHSPKNSPQKSNDQIDEKGLLQPESNHHVIYVMPPDATPEERHAIKPLSRVNDQLEQPVHRAKPAGANPLLGLSPSAALAANFAAPRNLPRLPISSTNRAAASVNTSFAQPSRRNSSTGIAHETLPTTTMSPNAPSIATHML